MNFKNPEPRELIDQILGDRSYCPCLLIGQYVSYFKQAFKETIERAYTLDEVKTVIEEYSGIQEIHSGVLVLDGVGYLSDVGQNSLLKFIEESKLPIVLLSATDRISPIIMSRMKMVYKLWYPVKSLNFSTVASAQKELLEKKRENQQMKEIDEVAFCAKNCPNLFAVRTIAGDPYDYSNRRMVGLVKWEEVDWGEFLD